MTELEAAVAELQRNPSNPVRAKVGELTVELRAVPNEDQSRSAADAFAELGPWEGETTEELLELLDTRRRNNRGSTRL